MKLNLLFTALLPGGWRAVADLDQLTSLTFRLAFSETFVQAVNSEVGTPRFSPIISRVQFECGRGQLQNFLSATPQTRSLCAPAPEVRFSSVDLPIPIVFLFSSFEVFTGADHRGESVTPFSTPAFVDRSEFAPSITIPLHWGPWLSATTNFTFRSTYYGGQMGNGAFVSDSLFRNTGELSIDIRPPSIERVWTKGDSKWKHVIEPELSTTM